MARNYNCATIRTADGEVVSAEFYTSGFTWGARLRGLRRWCERNEVAIEYPMWALMGGNAWHPLDIRNA